MAQARQDLIEWVEGRCNRCNDGKVQYVIEMQRSGWFCLSHFDRTAEKSVHYRNKIHPSLLGRVQAGQFESERDHDHRYVGYADLEDAFFLPQD